MRVTVIDNFDSFVYNLVQYIGELGGEPTVFMNNAPIQKVLKSRPDKIVISPGPKTPRDAGISVEVVRRLGKRAPTLGVCLGHQVVGYAFGAKIVPAKRLMHGKVSSIKHNGDSLFKGVPNPFKATRYHSLAIDRATLPKCLKIIAETVDGDRELMGIKHTNHEIYGVQFHPESILTKHGKTIVKNFLEI